MGADEKQLIRQGWGALTIQTAIIIVAIVGAFFGLKAAAAEAMAKAANAEDKALKVEQKTDAIGKSLQESREELVRIRTVLEERLPGHK